MKNKTVKYCIIFILVLKLLLGIMPVHAEKNFSELDRDTSFAGASLALSTFYEKNENADVKIMKLLGPIIALREKQEAGGTETLDPVIYPAPKIGTVCTYGNLNIRKVESVLSDVVGQLWHRSEVYVEGEHLVSGTLWYKIRVDLEGNTTEGYCVSEYILFDDAEVERYFAELRASEKSMAVMPTEFKIQDDITALPEDVSSQLTHFVKYINYSLKNDYPKAKAENQYMNMYAILVYLLENYQHALDIANVHGLKETAYALNLDIRTINFVRENLNDTTGTSNEEFQKQIQEAIVARQAAKKTTGELIADYAASFVGVTPYVWGGASLTKGADCSGFAAQIYAHFGMIDQAAANRHALDSGSMRRIGRGVQLSEILPGDLICYNGHVAIYYGNGIVVHSPNPGRKVEYGSLHMMDIITIRRMY